MIDIVQKCGQANTTSKSNRDIDYIVIHYTAGVTSKAGTAASTAAYFAKTSTQASADFIVDDETIVQYNPDIENRYCWAVGGSKLNTQGGSLHGIATNANCISIEICSTNDTGKITSANDSHWSFTDAVVDNALELTKYLMQEYNIDADHVIRHWDTTGKYCPGLIGWNIDSGDDSAWLAFKAKLKEADDMTGEEIYTKLNEYLTEQEAPDWAQDELQEAIDMGITDGTRPMQLIPRYQAAIMAKRAAEAK